MTKFLSELKNEFKVKDKSFYKILLMGLIVSLCLLISFFNKYFVWVAFALACVALLLTRGIKKVYILIFLYPFYGVMRMSFAERTYMKLYKIYGEIDENQRESN